MWTKVKHKIDSLASLTQHPIWMRTLDVMIKFRIIEERLYDEVVQYDYLLTYWEGGDSRFLLVIEEKKKKK